MTRTLVLPLLGGVGGCCSESNAQLPGSAQPTHIQRQHSWHTQDLHSSPGMQALKVTWLSQQCARSCCPNSSTSCLEGGMSALSSGWGRSSNLLTVNSSSPSQTRAWRSSLPATGHAKWLDRLFRTAVNWWSRWSGRSLHQQGSLPTLGEATIFHSGWRC